MTNKVLQFKITLKDTKPPIWRRIQIADSCSFWDLHVAIQDSMGWWDSHLHQFEVIEEDSLELQTIGFPDECDGGMVKLAGWKVKVKEYLDINNSFNYEYDFGDGWEHKITLEGAFDKIPKQKYPICLAGKKACPPEDVGGIGGFYDFLEAIESPEHDEHERLLEWVNGHYDPLEFEPNLIRFQNSKTRLQEIME